MRLARSVRRKRMNPKIENREKQMAARIEKAKGRVREAIGAFTGNERLKGSASLIGPRLQSGKAPR
jgi:hypothetical protein